MSNTMKLSSALPGDEEINGLDSLVPELLEDPTQVVCALVWFKVKDVRRVIERADGTPDEVPTVRIARVEPIDVVARVPKEITDLAAELYEKRTGKTPLPFSQLTRPDSEVVYTAGAVYDDELVDAEVVYE